MVANPGSNSLSTRKAKSSLLDGRPLVKRPRVFDAAGQVIGEVIGEVINEVIGEVIVALPFRGFAETQEEMSTCRAQLLAELSLTERSEVLRPSEARCSVRAKRGVMPRRRRRRKLLQSQARMRSV